MRLPLSVMCLLLCSGCVGVPAQTARANNTSEVVPPPVRLTTKKLPDKKTSKKGSSDQQVRQASVPPTGSIVGAGAQLLMGSNRVTFARYINSAHKQLHPEFAQKYLSKDLRALSSDHPLSDENLNLLVELQLDGNSGALRQVRVLRASGQVAFDEGSIAAIRRAAPFISASSDIHSSDGHVYIHWEFHRTPGYACSAYFARPYLVDFSNQASGSSSVSSK